MEEMDTVFSEIKNCLVVFDYPLAKSMDDGQLADIFHSSNRWFLISWMLKLLDVSYEVVVNSFGNDKWLLGNFLHELGFCTKKDGLPFMTGELQANKQLKILQKIFNFIISIKHINANEIKNVVKYENITLLKNMNLNLFPMYGDIKISKKNGNSFYKQEILKVSPYKDNKVFSSSKKALKDIDALLTTLKEKHKNVKGVVQNLEEEKDVEAKETIKLNPESAEILIRGNNHLKTINQFLKDLNTIQKFEASPVIEICEDDSKSELRETLKMLSEEFSMILKYSSQIY